MTAEVRRFGSQNDMNLQVAQILLQLARTAVRERGRFTWALSGGETPRRLYELLAQPPCLQLFPWKNSYLFWSDERCVGPAHAASNYGMAKRALLDKVPVPAAQIFRMPGEMEPPEVAAKTYAQSLRSFFAAAERGAPAPFFPTLDLILLGMGADGHTASLFPGDKALEEQRQWVFFTQAPPEAPVRRRLTLTLPLINRAGQVIFLVSGRGKEKTLQAVLADQGNPRSAYPAARVAPAASPLWCIDQI